MQPPKINLRDLFWLTLVVALAAGWWVDHSRAAAQYEQLKAFLEISKYGTRHMQREQQRKIDATLKEIESAPLFPKLW